MKLAAGMMDRPLSYRLWQAPFVEQKLAPIFAHNDLRRVRRVLDVGCGPGTNTRHFADAEYLGIDINEEYIEDARRRHNRNFLVADATTFTVPPGERFDFILVNSFLHHIDTPSTRRVLSHLSTLLTEDGHVHVLDLVLPERPWLARLLARCDRGRFPRPLEELRAILEETFEPVVFEPYRLTGLGATLWHMVYFKGQARR